MGTEDDIPRRIEGVCDMGEEPNLKKCRVWKHLYQKVGDSYERLKDETPIACHYQKYQVYRCVKCGDEFESETWLGVYDRWKFKN